MNTIAALKPSEVTMPTRILIVDNDLALCEFIHEVLTAEKIQSVAVNDSLQAAARLREERFDAVFLDMRMPVVDGIELATRIRSSGMNQHTPLIMITGEQDNKIMQRAFQAGVNLFLFKPVDRSRIMRLLNAAENFIQSQRRRFTRVKVCKGVSIEAGERRAKGTSLDLSVDGMCVRSSATFPIGSSVRVGLELHQGRPPLQFAARVVRLLGEDCMGLRIESGTTPGDRQLENFLLSMVMAKSDTRP
jgi:CheY-like chemotaxis protein